MKIHEFYKCEKCNEFHSIDYDIFIKRFTQQQDQIRVRNNMLVQINDWMSFLPTNLIRSYSNARNTRAVKLVDRSLDAMGSRILSVESRISSNCPEKREEAMMGRFYWEYCRCICKAIGTDEKTCMVELKNRSGSHYLPKLSLAGNGLAVAALNQYMKVFTTEPANQWIEITGFCVSLTVNPSWFSGNRVYQFPVRVYPTIITDFDKYFECALTTNNQNGPILTFFAGPLELDRIACMRDQTLTFWQRYLLVTQILTLRTWSVIRLVYYDNETKPRIWIRSPGTSRELTNSIADFLPIYAKPPNSNITGGLAQKLKEAQILAPINLKLKQNQEIMERLSRL